VPERKAEEQERAVGEVDQQGQHRWRVVQLQGPARDGGLLGGVEEGVEAAAVAEGDGGEVDIDGADTVAKTPLQCRAHQWSRFQVDFTGQGEQRPFPSVMAVDGELWEGHDASVQKTNRSARGDAGISGPLGALQAGTYVRLG
jgi:hypothetical protein